MNYKSKEFGIWLVLSLTPALFFIAFFLVFINFGWYRERVLYDSDINWLLKTGEYIYTNGFTIPAHDLYSYTAPKIDWVIYQWLFEVLLYLAFSIGSFQGIGLLATIIYALTFTVLFIILKKYNVNTLYCVIALSLGSWVASVTWYARPAIFTYLFICLLLLIFKVSENGKYKYYWFLPLIFLCWANLHLGFTSGIILIVSYLIYQSIKYSINKTEEQKKNIIVLSYTVVLSFIASLITPYGLKLYSYMLSLGTSGYMNNNIRELLSPNFHKDLYYPMLIIIVLIVTLSYFGGRNNYFYTFFLGLTTCMTLVFVRNIPFFGIFSSLALAIQLQNMQDYIVNNTNISTLLRYPFIILKESQDYEANILATTPKPIKSPLSSLVIITFIMIILPFINDAYIQKRYLFTLNYEKDRPYGAYNFVLKYLPPGRFYAQPTWGSYAILNLYPHYKVFIDTRFDMYGDKFFEEAHKIKLLRSGWEDLLSKYNVNWIVEPNDSLLTKKLRHKYKDYWFIIYTDQTATIFMLNTKQNREWYKKSEAKEHIQTIKK